MFYDTSYEYVCTSWEQRSNPATVEMNRWSFISLFIFMNILLVILYIISSAVSYGGTFAYLQKEWTSIADRQYRTDIAFSIGMSLVPIVWPVVLLFATWFYKHWFKFW